MTIRSIPSDYQGWPRCLRSSHQYQAEMTIWTLDWYPQRWVAEKTQKTSCFTQSSAACRAKCLCDGWCFHDLISTQNYHQQKGLLHGPPRSSKKVILKAVRVWKNIQVERFKAVLLKVASQSGVMKCTKTMTTFLSRYMVC
jgi:hypothetical protein